MIVLRHLPFLVAILAFGPVPAAPTDPTAAEKANVEPVQLAMAAVPAKIEGKSYDVIVLGGTPGGIACAVRAAREGATVLLVNHTGHLGGMMANGLMQWDALYGGSRAPLFSELLRNIESYYRTVYGADSTDFKTVHFTREHYPIGWAEPHVAEREFNRLIVAEKNLTLLLKCDPVAVTRAGAQLTGLTLHESGGGKAIHVHGTIFVDATYEGDLLPLAKVAYRVGREGRDEFNEPHAGKVFTNIEKGNAPKDAVEGRLNIRPYTQHQGSIDADSPFTADGAVQAYNHRLCVTKDPANRIMLAQPPPGYNREEYVHFERKSIATNAGPNSKSHMNSPILPGENHEYPEGSWELRDKIIARHLDFALGLIWFLQNDEAVPLKQREKFREWGLPKDEFVDHDHVPYETYVREARRLRGRYIFTEHDGMLAKDYARTPVHEDSVAITDWYMDSHSCTTDSRPGFRYDGKLILTEESRPAQIPYRCFLPQGLDNLLVPVCLSATHVAWGSVRLEPVWMETGEAAGVAAALSLKTEISPAKLDAEHLVRELCARHFMVSFFNDVNVESGETWIPAVEYFGSKGFFPGYDARPNEELDVETAKLWARGLASLFGKQLKPQELAAQIYSVKVNDGSGMNLVSFGTMLKQTKGVSVSKVEVLVDKLRSEMNSSNVLSRGAACLLLLRILEGR
jgi:hypothetical protein